MQILEMESFPIEQVRDLQRLELDLAQFVSTHQMPMRFLFSAHGFAMDIPIAQIDARLRDLAPIGALADALLPSLQALTVGDASQPHPADVVAGLSDELDAVLADICATALPVILDDPEAASAAHWLALGEVLESLIWTRPELYDLRHFYTKLAERRLRAATFILIIWEPPTANVEEIINSLSYTTGRRVCRRDQLRPILPGPVTVDEQRARLIPIDAAHPHLAVLRSYDMPIEIDARVLHPLLNGERDVMIAVDILPIPHGRALYLAEMQHRAASVALRSNSGTIDPQTAQRAASAERTMYELRTSSLHQVQVAVLVQGTDAEDLTLQVAAARDRLGLGVRVEAVAGSQAELLKLFSTIPAAKIDAAWTRSDALAHGVGCLMGAVGFHRSPLTEGWLFGIDSFRQSAVFFDPFSGNRAGHMVYIGVTGYGKTFGMNLLTLRAAVQAGYRVIWVDADENSGRLERAIGAGATRHILGAGRTVNPLDLAFDPEEEPAWMSLQAGHVIAQLAMMMGQLGSDAQGRSVLIPRAFTKEEEGYLQRAIAMLYVDLPPRAPLTAMPILADVITALELIDAEEQGDDADALAEDEDALDDDDDPREARALARTLRKMIYGSKRRTTTRTAFGHNFNGITTVDWSFENDVTCIDLTGPRGAGDLNLDLYYSQAISTIYRYMRHPRRDRTRKTLLILDEMGLASRISSVAQMGVTISKVARKYGMALVTADQLPNFYLDTPEGQQIFGNSRVRVIYHLKDPEARRLAEAIPELTEAHIQHITRGDVGRCVVVYDNIVVPVDVEPAPRELQLLQGS
ncbi:hypothetical protein K2Z83_25865 [Oscillochloris sp. ZM17-4]|uniref:VirB4 family type IV secretion system protein n=1 Tax=Oscillochloris sp. ZM17-4 TaxID=2866714 RepID=UPI001C737EBC|nr:hypothetical protein [Oscillochloris sp. ZM17-4]MBX0331083.1 hypothetical protein [Oscillochloris sp. ZM17-4]